MWLVKKPRNQQKFSPSKNLGYTVIKKPYDALCFLLLLQEVMKPQKLYTYQHLFCDYVYVCMYMYMDVCICICMYVYVYVYVYGRMYIYVYGRMYM